MLLLLFLWFLLACSKEPDSTVIIPPTITDTIPAQYGTPFGNVPDREDAVIYQVNMRAFSQQSNFNGVIARLDSIKALGVNVIYLMPIYPVGTVKSVNSPYCIKNYTAVNSEFGTLAEGNRSSHFLAGFDYIFGFSYYGLLKSIYKSNASALMINDMNNTEYTNASNGQQVGTPFRLVFPFTGRNIDWTLNPDIMAEYKRILLFRSTSSAMRHGQLSTYGDKDIVAFTKEVTGEKVLVVSNLRNKAINFSVPFPLQNTTWTYAMTGESITLTTQLDLQPYSYLIAKQ